MKCDLIKSFLFNINYIFNIKLERLLSRISISELFLLPWNKKKLLNKLAISNFNISGLIYLQ